MMAGYPIRVRIGVLSIVVFALVSSGLALRRTLDPPPGAAAHDEISRYEARFRPLRSALPPEGVVGYLAGPRRLDRPFDDLKDFYLTQYALAPLIVVDTSDPPFVVGNFRPSSPEHTISDPTLVLIRDFGDGVLLFRHQPR